MRVLVAGATGAVGRPLVGRLLLAGHDVVGLTRRGDRAAELRAAGAQAVVGDALDAARLREIVLRVAPDAVVDQLTSLPRDYDVRRKDVYDANDRVRARGTGALVDAAREAGVRRYVLQSVAFLYAPEGGWVKDEGDRAWADAPAPFGRSVDVLVVNERKVVDSAAFDGIVLRYGFFYGPGTYYAPQGAIAEQVRRRRFPVVGRGDGVSSFVHVDDAATAVVAALERRAPGRFNIVDDEPAPLREWLPRYAEAIRAAPPRRIPGWVARLAAGPFPVAAATRLRGASNAKARRELGWQPAIASWRDGFATALDRHLGAGGG
jgi:nucleoside-diphosphate-sugar epimerase